MLSVTTLKKHIFRNYHRERAVNFRELKIKITLDSVFYLFKTGQVFEHSLNENILLWTFQIYIFVFLIDR